ncbi:MAG: GAF domain-containing protein, partial [Gaiellales bacterium]
MRFRLKLSIVLVGLALIPLIGATLVVQELLGRNETSRVDGQLDSAAAAAAVAYRAQLADARQLAVAIAARPDVQRAFVERSGAGLDLTGLTGGLPVQLVDRQGPFAGTPPIGPAARISVQVGPPAARRRLLVWLPIDAQLLDQIVANSGRADHVDLALVAGGRVVASTSGKLGPTSPLRPGTSQDASLGGTAVRAQAVALPLARGGPGELVSAYPQSRISDTVNSMRLRVIVPAALLALLAIGLALLAADRISRALSDLAARALALARSTPSESSDGDELVVLGAAIDTMSGELSTRMDELEAERGRLKLTLARYGETLAATHDLRALLGAVLDTAVQATRARGGRLMLYDGERGEAVEQTRIGTARGSRTDLPMVVAAGRGLEGEALQAQEPRSADTPRSVVAVPILREHQLLGLVTVVDPEEGTFGADDVETLAGLAVQAGVAIENARLHRVVEQQAI